MMLYYREKTELSSAVMTGWILLFLSILMGILIYVNGTDPNEDHANDTKKGKGKNEKHVSKEVKS